MTDAKHCRSNAAGFTMIEVMIAMTILAFISLGVYDITTSTFARRESIEQEGDFYNSIRVGLEVLGRDLSQLYTPQASALPGDLGKPPQPSAAVPGQPSAGASMGSQLPLGTPTDFWGEPVNQQGVRPSRFQGDETKMTFVANSHVRIYRDSMESELARITYTLEDPKSPSLSNGKVLVKYEDTNIHDEDERSSDDSETRMRLPLLENVKSLTFEYLDGEKDTWDKRWDTSGIDHKGVFPAVIKATVEIFMSNSENSFLVVQQYRPELEP